MTDDRRAVNPVIEGHVVHVDTGYDIAIYTRDDAFWVAEFRDGQASLTEATTWFRFHSAPLRYCSRNRAGALDSTALTPGVLAQIERLHGQVDGAARRTLTAALVNAVRRWTAFGRSSVRASAPRGAQDLG